MASSESNQTKLTRVRKPRVHITYNVETGGAMEKKELPLVVGVLADLSGDRDPERALPKPKHRKFVKIDRDDFDNVMSKIGPRLVLKDIKNTMDPDGPPMSAILNFERLSDFNPEKVVEHIPQLKELLDRRAKLKNLRNSLDGNDRLDELLLGMMKPPGNEKAHSGGKS